jgi:hypothetical protein
MIHLGLDEMTSMVSGCRLFKQNHIHIVREGVRQMRYRPSPWMMISLLFLGLAGCQRTIYTTSPGKGIYAGTLNAPVVGSLEVCRKAHFLFWGLKTIHAPDIEDVAARQLQAGQALADIQIVEKNSFVDGLLAGLTYGIYRPRTVLFTGKIYNLKGAQNVQ